VQAQAAEVKRALTETQPADWDVIKHKFEDAVALGGEALGMQLASPDPQQIRDGLNLAFTLARGLSGDALRASVAATQERQQASAALKQSTALGASSLRPAPTEGETGGDISMEEAKAAFYRAILGADTTTVAEGLTFGPAGSVG
jgi:hypothetical protein